MLHTSFRIGKQDMTELIKINWVASSVDFLLPASLVEGEEALGVCVLDQPAPPVEFSCYCISIHLLRASPAEGIPLILRGARAPFVEVGWSTVHPFLVQIQLAHVQGLVLRAGLGIYRGHGLSPHFDVLGGGPADGRGHLQGLPPRLALARKPFFLIAIVAEVSKHRPVLPLHLAGWKERVLGDGLPVFPQKLVFLGELEDLSIPILNSEFGLLELLPQVFVAFEQFPHHIDALDEPLRYVAVVVHLGVVADLFPERGTGHVHLELLFAVHPGVQAGVIVSLGTVLQLIEKFDVFVGLDQLRADLLKLPPEFEDLL